MDLEQRVAILEAELVKYKQVLQAILARVKQTKPQDTKEIVYSRYLEGKKNNRTISEANELIALVAHLHYKKGISLKNIAASGIMSRGKTYGLGKWDMQFLMDFLEVHNVTEIFEHGSTNNSLLKKYPQLYSLLGE